MQVRSFRSERPFVNVCAWAFVPALLLLAFVAFGAWRHWFVVSELTLDLAAITKRPVYFGAVSGVGFKLWAGTAAICALAALTARRQGNSNEQGMFARFGALSLLLLVDDWLLLHEHVVPIYLGLSEKVLMAIYGGGTLMLLATFRRQLLRHDWPLLLAAFSLFAASVITDQITGADVTSQRLMLIEDGTKLLGISAWFAFFFSAALRLVKPSPTVAI